MKVLKNIFRTILLLVIAIFCVITVHDFSTRPMLIGFIAMWVFIVAFNILVSINTPTDEDKTFIDYGRNLG